MACEFLQAHPISTKHEDPPCTLVFNPYGGLDSLSSISELEGMQGKNAVLKVSAGTLQISI